MDELFKEFTNFTIMKPTVAKVATPSPAKGNSKPHNHPSMSVPYKVEKSYTESRSGNITEGCEKHYSERIVALDQTDSEYTSPLLEIDPEEMQNYIIMGEILAPKFDRII
jgi:hypothetical protein